MSTLEETLTHHLAGIDERIQAKAEQFASVPRNWRAVPNEKPSAPLKSFAALTARKSSTGAIPARAGCTSR
jgi:hypothetical protein